MKTVILCGGRGLRYNNDKPKSLAMIGYKPIIHHLMDIYSMQGFNEFILCLGYKQKLIVDYFNDINHDFNIDFVNTYVESNTAKRIKLIEKYIPKKDHDFFCNYSDGLSNVDLNKLYIKHFSSRKIATLTVVKPTNPFGVVLIDNNNNVLKFQEKPKLDSYINGGFYVFNRKIFDLIDINENNDLEKSILPELAHIKQLYAYEHKDFWETLNTQKDEINLNKLYNDKINKNEELDWLNV